MNGFQYSIEQKCQLRKRKKVDIWQEVRRLNCFLKLIEPLSAYNNGMFDGYVIAKAIWKMQGEIVHTKVNIEKQRTGYAVIRVEGRNESGETSSFLQVTLFQSAGITIRNAQQDGWNASCARTDDKDIVITSEQVQQYLADVRDTNPIHQGDYVIVPGLLLLLCLQKLHQSESFFTDGRVYKAQFHCPLYVDMICRITIENDMLIGVTPDGSTAYLKVKAYGMYEEGE